MTVLRRLDAVLEPTKKTVLEMKAAIDKEGIANHRVAQALKVERNWLLHGMGEVQGEEPIVEHPDDSFVAISSVAVRPSMRGGHLIEQEPLNGRPYHFQRSWIKQGLRSDPANLRIMHVEATASCRHCTMVTSCWSISAGARLRHPAYSCFTMA